MKRIFFLLVFSLLISLPAAEHPFALSENGKAQCVIALPEKPSRYDRMAADDLKFYLGKISREALRIKGGIKGFDAYNLLKAAGKQVPEHLSPILVYRPLYDDTGNVHEDAGRLFHPA